MNIEKLYDLINNAWNGETGSFSLDMAVLESAAVTRLWGWFLPSAQIQFEKTAKPELLEENGIKKVRIREAVYPKEFMTMVSPSVSAEFWIKEGEVQLVYNFSTSVSGFKLSAVFPELETYQIDSLTYKSPGFTITTAPDDGALAKLQNQFADLYYDEELDKTLKRGLVFNGVLQTPEEMQWLLDLLGVSEITVNGPIQIFENNIPRLLLTATQKKDFTISEKISLGLSFQMVALYSVMESDEDGEKYDASLDTFYRFSATFNYALEGGDKLSLPISAVFYGSNPQDVTFELDAKEVTAYALDQLAGMVNQTSLAQWTEGLQGFPDTKKMLVSMLSVSVRLDKGITVTNTEMNLGFNAGEKDGFELVPGILNINSLFLVFGVNDPFTSGSSWYASMGGTISLPNSELNGELYGNVSLPRPRFEVGLTEYSYINMTGLINRLLEQVQLPKLDIPLIECDELQIKGGIQPIALRFNTSVRSDEGLDIGGLFKLKQLGMVFDYGDKGIKQGTVMLGAELQVGQHYTVNLSGGLKSGDWFISGSFKAEEDHPLSLKDFLPEGVTIPNDFLGVEIKDAKVDLNLSKKSFSFTLNGRVYLDFEEAGHLECNTISVSVAKKAEGKGYDWTVSSKGFIELLKIDWTGNGDERPLIELGGELEITNTPDISISFKADEEKNVIRNIPILIPYKVKAGGGIDWSLMDFHFDSITLKKDDKKWSFSAGFILKMTRVIEQIKQFLPEKGFQVELAIADKKGSIKLVDDVINIPIPKFTIPKVPNSDFGPFDIGAAQLSLANLKLSIGKGIEASFEIRFYLPENFNTIFGKDGDKPQWDLFYTYPDKEHYLGITFKAEVSSKLNISAALTNLPLKTNFLKPYKEDVEGFEGKEKWLFQLGKDGEFLDIIFTFPVLNFVMSKGGFECDIYFKLRKSPAIPLGFLKQFFKNAGQNAIAERLPAKVPVPLMEEDLPQIINSEGRMDLDEFNKFFDNKIPQQALDALKPFEEVVNRLPTEFVKYLKFEIPTEFKLSITVSPTGSVEVSFYSDPALKMLFFAPPFRVQGLRLKKFSFGTLFGGALFSLSVDADFDDFDLISLGAAALFSDNESVKKIIGNPRDYHSRLALHNLFVIIVYQTYIPIPIPLFYDKIGIDYYGLGDVKITSGAKFPASELDFLKTFKFFGEVVKFLTKEDARLDPDIHPGVDFKFTLNPSYLQLPQWAGGQKYGLVDGIDFPSAYQLVAYLLNGIKFFDLNPVVSSLPLDKRGIAGEITFNFVCVQKIKGGSIISTVQNFIPKKEYLQMGITDEKDAKTLMDMLPGNVGKDDKAVVTFTTGKWEAPIGSLDFSFGAVSNGIKQFGFATTMSGKIAGIFDGKFSTKIGISASNSPFLAAGEGHLEILNIPLYKGEYSVKLENGNFGLDGNVDLFDERYPFFFKAKAKGHIDSNNVLLSGGITRARLLIFETSGGVTVSNTGIGAEIFGSSFSVNVIDTTLQIKGVLDIPLTKYTTEIKIDTKPGVTENCSLSLIGETIAGLLNTSITYRGNALQFNNNLDFNLTLLGIPTFTGKLTTGVNHFSVSGNINVTLGPFTLIGGISGSIRENNFSIGGIITIKTLLADFETKITISNNGISGSVKIGKAELPFYILGDGGCIKIKVGDIPELRICTFAGTEPATEYIFNTEPLTARKAVLIGSADEPGGEYGVLYAKGYPHGSELFQLLIEHLMEFSVVVHSEDKNEIEKYGNRVVATERLSTRVVEDDTRAKVWHLRGTSGEHGKRFFEELKEYVDKKLAKEGFKETLNIDGATYEMELHNNGILTKGKILLHFPNAVERMQRATYEYEGITPHYTMFGKIALQMMGRGN